jgi:hypothetical protein
MDWAGGAGVGVGRGVAVAVGAVVGLGESPGVAVRSGRISRDCCVISSREGEAIGVGMSDACRVVKGVLAGSGAVGGGSEAQQPARRQAMTPARSTIGQFMKPEKDLRFSIGFFVIFVANKSFMFYLAGIVGATL